MPALTTPAAEPKPVAPDSERWRAALRHFHLTAEVTGPLRDVSAARAALPAALLEPGALLRGWPLVLPLVTVNGDPAEILPLGEVVRSALGELGPGSMLAGRAPRLVLAFARILDGSEEVVPFAEVVGPALAAFREDFDLSDSGANAFDEALAALAELLPGDAGLLGMSANAPLALYLWLRLRDHRRRVNAFVAEVRRLCNGLSDLLRLHAERGDEAREPTRMAGSLGGGAVLFDPRALAAELPRLRGTRPLTAVRAERIERSLAALTLFAETAEQSDGVHLVLHANQADPATGPGVGLLRSDRPLEAAGALFDAEVDELLDVFRAVRVARLELEGAYDEALHDPILGRFSWQALSADELRLVPVVVVLERAERLESTALVAYSALLRSGRPVQLLVAGPAVPPPPAAERRLPGSYGAGPGYRTMAYREVFVVQTTLAEPAHLAAGLAEMSSTLRPAVAFVALPHWLGESPWLELAAAHQGRATPCFTYRPDAGSTFAERLELAANPQPERPWPEHVAAEGVESLPFTFADAAAISPDWAEHLCRVPEQGWNDELVPIAEYLEAPNDGEPTIPYVATLARDGRPGRAIVSRELAFACRDHRQAWRILQELSGIDSAHARAAAAAAREQASEQARAELEALRAEHQEELEEVERRAAEQAMQRLTAVLLNLDELAPLGAPAASPPPAATVSPPTAGPTLSAVSPGADGHDAQGSTAAPAAHAAAADAAAAADDDDDDDDDVGFGEPYIDTPLCTSCNECTQRNPKLFAYDANKQAYIADATAGTFEQLVQAAEECPAHIIHPGHPRADDSSVTDELIARAGPLN